MNHIKNSQFLLVVIGALLCEHCLASPPAEHSTVEELLRIDSRMALESARRQVFVTPSGSALSAPVNDSPVLVAIYGTGRNLSAEVLIGGRTVVYHGKARQPVSGLSLGYSLERIAPPCVYFLKKTAQSDQSSQEITCLEFSTP